MTYFKTTSLLLFATTIATAPLASAAPLFVDTAGSCMDWSLLNQSTNEFVVCEGETPGTEFRNGSCTMELGESDAIYNLRYGGFAGYNLTVTNGVIDYRGTPPEIDGIQPSAGTLTFNTALVRFRAPKTVRDVNGIPIGGWTGTWDVDRYDIDCDNGKNRNRNSDTINSRNLYIVRGARIFVPSSATLPSGEVRNEGAFFRIVENDRLKQVFNIQSDVAAGRGVTEVETPFFAGQEGEFRGKLKIVLNRHHWADAILPIVEDSEEPIE